MSMVGEVCARIHNYFETDPVTGARMIYQGRYTITNGAIAFPELLPGQYFRVFGSEQNDGVHQYGVDQLTDESFTGVVWVMNPPREFLNLVDEIESWVAEYGEAAKAPYVSENVINVYHYEKRNGVSGWYDVFKDRLKPFVCLP